MDDATVTGIENAPVFARGDGVVTTLLVGTEICGKVPFTSGLTRFPSGKKVPFHSHNCDEQVTLIEGEALVEIEGRDSVPVKRHDTAFIPRGNSHRFINTGAGELMILWVYATDHVTRTFTETGETVPHLSESDLVTAG